MVQESSQERASNSAIIHGVHYYVNCVNQILPVLLCFENAEVLPLCDKEKLPPQTTCCCFLCR